MENNDEVIGLKGIIVRYLRHWKLFLIVFILSFIPAILYLVFYPRTYEFKTRIQIQEEQSLGGASLGSSSSGGAAISSCNLTKPVIPVCSCSVKLISFLIGSVKSPAKSRYAA